MNYSNNELISVLSAEYVLGTLRGKARDRFETLKFNNNEIIQMVEYWESQLNGMSLKVTPISPSNDVWTTIAKRLGFKDAGLASTTSNVVSIHQEQTPTQASPPANQKWKWVSGLALAASFIMAVVLVRMDSMYTQPVQSVVVFNNADTQPLWSIDIVAEYFNIKTTAKVPLMPNNDYQLWMLPGSGEAPISVGVMRQTGEYKLSKPAQFDEMNIAALAVSKEPKGGSLTGSPTEVLFAAEIAQL